jgi:hypothetical protein
MNTFRFALLATASGLLLAALACVAHAQHGVELAYDAPDGCPSRMEFIAAVERRGGRFDGEGALQAHELVVSVAKQQDDYVGAFRMQGAKGASGVREVHARACAEVSEALAVIAAIALGSQAEARAEEHAAALQETDHAGRTAGSPQPQPAPNDEPALKPQLRGSVFEQDKTLRVDAGTMRFDSVAHYTLLAGAEFGLIPGVVLPRYDLVISRANLVTPPSASSRLVGQVLQVHWSWLGPATYTSGDLSTRVYGLQAGLRSCAGLTYDMDGLTLLGCAEFGLGWMKLETKDPQKLIQSKDTGFGFAGLGLDAEYSLGAHWHLALRVGGRMQIGGISAERSDGSRILKASLFGGYALAGLGLHFW